MVDITSEQSKGVHSQNVKDSNVADDYVEGIRERLERREVINAFGLNTQVVQYKKRGVFGAKYDFITDHVSFGNDKNGELQRNEFKDRILISFPGFNSSITRQENAIRSGDDNNRDDYPKLFSEFPLAGSWNHVYFMTSRNESSSSYSKNKKIMQHYVVMLEKEGLLNPVLEFFHDDKDQIVDAVNSKPFFEKIFRGYPEEDRGVVRKRFSEMSDLLKKYPGSWYCSGSSSPTGYYPLMGMLDSYLQDKKSSTDGVGLGGNYQDKSHERNDGVGVRDVSRLGSFQNLDAPSHS